MTLPRVAQKVNYFLLHPLTFYFRLTKDRTLMGIKIYIWIRLALVVNRFNTVMFLRCETVSIRRYCFFRRRFYYYDYLLHFTSCGEKLHTVVLYPVMKTNCRTGLVSDDSGAIYRQHAVTNATKLEAIA